MNKRIKKKKYTLLVQKCLKAVRKRYPNGMVISVPSPSNPLTEADKAEIESFFKEVGAKKVVFE